MAREIKFRSWNKTFKEMYFYTIGDLMEDSRRAEFANNMMQYTGLKDKNGKEIYEGDVVVSDAGSKGFVLFENYTYGIKDRLDKIGGLNPLSNMRSEYWTVIGNIHQHPEPL